MHVMTYILCLFFHSWYRGLS